MLTANVLTARIDCDVFLSVLQDGTRGMLKLTA